MPPTNQAKYTHLLLLVLGQPFQAFLGGAGKGARNKRKDERDDSEGPHLGD